MRQQTAKVIICGFRLSHAFYKQSAIIHYHVLRVIIEIEFYAATSTQAVLASLMVLQF